MAPAADVSRTVNKKPAIVTFSGIDGSGKSTQIERLHNTLEESGLSVLRLVFWDNVVSLPQFRAGVSHKVLRGELGVGAPGKPVRRNDKNARKWYLTLARSPFYFFDVLSLRRAVSRARASDVDVVIFDRYIYDQLANVSGNLFGRLYTHGLLALAPRPDVSYLLDADPEAALARKPEYPIEFLHAYRKAYHRIARMAPHIIVVPAADVDTVQRVIVSELRKSRPRQFFSEPTDTLQKSELSA